MPFLSGPFPITRDKSQVPEDSSPAETQIICGLTKALQKTLWFALLPSLKLAW